MTHHLTGRPIPRTVGPSAYGPTVAGVTAALVGLALTAVPVLVLWVFSPYPQDTAADAARLVGCLWLLAHGGPLTRGAAAPLSLTPLLLTLLTVLLLHRAGARAAGPAPVGGRARGVPAALCAGYLAVALPVALECSTPGALRARVLPDLVAVAVLAYASAALGARTVPTAPRWWPAVRQRVVGRIGPVPRWARPAAGTTEIVRAAAAGLLTLLAGGALLLAVAVVLRTDTTDPTVRVLTGGSLPGTAGLLLTCLLLLPDAALWSAAYALGPGFLLGTGTTVAPGRVVLGAVPDFPLLALAPLTASPWQDLVYAVPTLAGTVCTGLLGRAAARGGARPGPSTSDGTSPDASTPWHPAATAVAALGTALTAGAAVALAAWLAGGALGGGRMAELGPPVWWSAAAAAGWIAALALPGALAVRWWLLRRPAPTNAPADAPAPSDAPAEETEPRDLSRRRALLARARRAVTLRRRRDE